MEALECLLLGFDADAAEMKRIMEVRGMLCLGMPPYYLAACADDARAVAESEENNNCRVSSTTLTLQKADLAVSAVSNPPAAGVVGTTFTVDDTTANGGAVAAGASTTRYRLSPDATITGSDPLLTGMRAVPGLGVGAASAGSGTVVTIPASVPAGTFYLGACADDAGAVSESDETNNCRGSATQITVTKANLRVTSVSEPPQEGDVGLSFEVTDVTANQGLTPAAASATRYRLSLDATITAADPLLTGTRSVPAFGVGGTSAGTVTVTIPDTVVQGSYYLGACADGAGAVPESNENNNCAVSRQTAHPDDPNRRSCYVPLKSQLYDPQTGNPGRVVHYIAEVSLKPEWLRGTEDTVIPLGPADIKVHTSDKRWPPADPKGQLITGEGPGGLGQGVGPDLLP